MKTIFTPEYRKLIGWLAAERRFQKISQSDLANKMGFLNSTYISKIEQFDRKLDIAEYVQFCKAIDVDPHEGINILIKGR
ncbi:MAG: helix-turn-helix transcriptional regulator [Gammaproteobacteria bacterium]|nr:helix-turn-helix transcriptional regulator [Gammaproteobacteria bacterium]